MKQSNELQDWIVNQDEKEFEKWIERHKQWIKENNYEEDFDCDNYYFEYDWMLPRNDR